jgi:hypothetical protein
LDAVTIAAGREGQTRHLNPELKKNERKEEIHKILINILKCLNKLFLYPEQHRGISKNSLPRLKRSL